MKIYTVKDDKSASDILLLVKLNTACAQLHWSRSIKDIPSNVINAIETLEEYVETKIIDLCGNAKYELTEEEECDFLNIVKQNDKLRETLGTGVVRRGSQADEVKSLLKAEKRMYKVLDLLARDENIIIF